MAYAPTAWNDDALPDLTAAQLNRIEQGVADAYAGVSIPFVIALPAGPVDGQEVYFVADALNGVIWHLKYRQADPSAYKWQYVGGSELENVVLTGEWLQSATYAILTTPGPNVTVPLAGDYDVTLGASSFANTGSADAAMSFQTGGTAAIDADRTVIGATTGYTQGSSRTVRKTAVAANTQLSARYKGNAPQTWFLDRFMRVRPVRVG